MPRGAEGIRTAHESLLGCHMAPRVRPPRCPGHLPAALPDPTASPSPLLRRPPLLEQSGRRHLRCPLISATRMKLRTRTRIARTLRRRATEGEKALWWALREAFPAERFRRQHPIGRHIVDFACPSHKLAVEIDGGQHAGQEAADIARTEDIRTYGYRVIRFWNHEVLRNLPGVLQSIARELSSVGIALSALKGGEGGDPPQRGGEGEVGVGKRLGIPHLTPTLSAPKGGEGPSS
jgi:very-short-patch-repair endonuclease